MSDDTPDESQAHSTTSDTTSTREIPRVDEAVAPAKKKPAKKPANKKPAKKAAPKKPAVRKPVVPALHGHVEPHDSVAAKDAPAEDVESKDDDDAAAGDPATPDTDEESADSMSVKDDTPVTSKDAEPEAAGEPKESKAPLTAGDYARTTQPSPSTTAVIPAVEDKQRDMPEPKVTVAPEPRVAILRLSRVEPWTVTKLAFAVSVALMVVAVVAVTIFWIVLNAAGVWDQINEAVTKVLSDNPSSFDITQYLGFGRLVGLTLVLSAINVVLMTALATISAHLYNLAAQLLGGVEVKFSDEH